MHAFASSLPLPTCAFSPCAPRSPAKRRSISLRISMHSSSSSSSTETDGDFNSISEKPLLSQTPRLSRRALLQLFSAGVALSSLTLLFNMRSSFRFISANSLLQTLGLDALPLPTVSASTSASSAFDIPTLSSVKALISSRDANVDFLCPEFPVGKDWLNSRPLRLSTELRGKVTLLDFFTYCCINCQHVLSSLCILDKKYPSAKGFVVIGVHSAKFTAERNTASVQAALEKSAVTHPVFNDDDMTLWNQLGISSWPTLVLLGPRANLLAVWTGEPAPDVLETYVQAALEFYKGKLNYVPLPEPPGNVWGIRRFDSTLRYPGKVAVDPNMNLLYVSDTANHRVLEIDVSTGNVIRIFGSGTPGLRDNSVGTEAQFLAPQGVAVYKGSVFVADTGSHAVRQIDIATGSVSTIGGTGMQGMDYTGGKTGVQQPLSSPWDVEPVNDLLYVAMAGTHQIWRVDISGQQKNWEVYSGSGRELLKNSNVARTAAWAQPSHLSFGNGEIFVADSESSSVRAVHVHANGNVENCVTRTLAGGDAIVSENLFAFGDVDGKGSRARFQHPLAVAVDIEKKIVYVADSYNHKIKTVDVNTGVVRQFVGNGKPGFEDGDARNAKFWEPAGLALSSDGSLLFVADTNNSAVRVVDTRTKNVSTMKISERSGKDATASKNSSKPLIVNRRRAVILREELLVAPAARLDFAVRLPLETHFTPGAVSRYQLNFVSSGETEERVVVEGGEVTRDEQRNVAKFSVDLGKGIVEKEYLAEVECMLYYCTDAEGVCKTAAQIYTFDVDEGGRTGVIVLDRDIVPRRGGLAAPGTVATGVA